MKREANGPSRDDSKPEILKSFNSRIRNATEDAVIDWVTKYFLDDSNLALINFDDKNKLKAQISGWTTGVVERIRHQLVDSGFRGSDRIEPLIGYYLYEHLRGYPRYTEIRDFLPFGVRSYDPSLQKKVDAEDRPAA
ncbi:hypothetical protein K2P56_03025 [Patescibacteria group bacterium]|nr:hypothetical protein [Patescibacteria group bacterium]